MSAQTRSRNFLAILTALALLLSWAIDARHVHRVASPGSPPESAPLEGAAGVWSARASRPDRQAVRALRAELEKDGAADIFGNGSDHMSSLLDGNPRGRLIVTQAVEIARAAAACLREDLCGEGPDDDHAYFDPDDTPTHQILAQSLRAIEEGQILGLLDRGVVSVDELAANLSIKNAEVQLLSAQILLGGGDRATAAAKLLEHRDEIVAEAQPAFFGLLSSDFPVDSETHRETVAGLTESFSRDPGTASLELLRGLKQITLDEEEFLLLARAVCSASVNRPSLWRAGRAYLKHYQIEHGFSPRPILSCAHLRGQDGAI